MGLAEAPVPNDGPKRSMHPRALLLDLDGTVIGRESQVSARVAQAVGRVSSHLGVSIVSGREPADVLRFARQLRLTAPQVSDGGAMILEPASGECLWRNPLHSEQAEEIVTTLRDMGASFIATHPGGTATSFAEIPDWDLTRVSALDLEEGVADRLAGRHDGLSGIHAVKSFLPYNGLWAVDFTDEGVSKATAVARLAAMAGIDPGQIIAAGDSFNDLPMMEACGLRVAMGDSPDELKALADYIAPSVEDDGLAVAIEEFVLPMLVP